MPSKADVYPFRKDRIKLSRKGTVARATGKLRAHEKMAVFLFYKFMALHNIAVVPDNN
ncbi:MAG TPA: hypothetical protein PK926_02905 [Spirochaetota bacterium]|nr:hypothetical protein [Spirochaetota bacterium]HPI87970.1 hypothetical protein [Spirochaetota bacterium]HPR46681.1 hypothetical protein [Spirochaetota bacterium]